MVMTREASFVLGLTLGVLLVSCATAAFPYKYRYPDENVDYTKGALIGDVASNDVAFSTCAPTATNKRPCTCLETPTFLALKLDYQDTQQKLKECESKLAEAL